METQLQPGVQSEWTQAVTTLLRHAHTHSAFLCRKFFQNPEEAEQIVQQVLEAVYRQHQTLENPSAFLGWVNRMTARFCVNALLKKGHSFAFGGVWGPEPEAACRPTGILNSRALAQQMEIRVDTLPESLRLCVYLHAYAQMTVREIARLMQVSEGEIRFGLQEAGVMLGTLSVEDGAGRFTVCPMPYLGDYLRQRALESADDAAAARMIQNLLPEKPPVSEEPNYWDTYWSMPEEDEVPLPSPAPVKKKSNVLPILFAIFAILCAICVGLAAAVMVNGGFA